MNHHASPPLHWYQRPAVSITLGVVLVSVLVLLIEATFVMSTGWAFKESIIGGRIMWRTVLLLVFMPVTAASLLSHFSGRTSAQPVVFTVCVVAFALLACWFSVEFTL